MKFKSEEERSKHPHASLIPYALWAEVYLFNSCLSANDFTLMASSLERISAKPLSLTFHSEQNQLTAWLCILLSHPQDTTDNLLITANNIGLPEAIIFQGAIITGNMAIIEKLNTTEINLVKTIAANDFLIFVLAMALNHRDSVNWLLATFPSKKEAMVKAHQFGAFEWAARHGLIHQLELFKKIAPHLLKKMIANAFSSAAYDGQLEVIKWFTRQIERPEIPEHLPEQEVQQETEKKKKLLKHLKSAKNHVPRRKPHEEETELVNENLNKLITSNNFTAFFWASSKGHLFIMEWLAKSAPSLLTKMIEAETFSAFRRAAAYKKLDILKWLAKKAPQHLQAMIEAEDYFAFRSACSKNDLPTVNWLLQNVAKEKLSPMLQSKNFSAFHAVAENGNLPLMQQLKDLVGDKFLEMVASDNYYGYRAAANIGCIDILEWFEKQVTREEQNNFNHKDAFLLAMDQGHVRVLDWFKVRFHDDISIWIKDRNYLDIFSATANGHLDALRWVNRYFPELIKEAIAFKDYFLLRYAAAHNQLNILQWIREVVIANQTTTGKQYLESMVRAQNYAAFNEAAKGGYVPILTWLQQQVAEERHEFILSANNFQIAQSAAENGRHEVFIWLFDHSKILEKTHEKKAQHLKEQRIAMFTTAFLAATLTDQVHLLHWLRKKFPSLQDNFTTQQKEELARTLTILHNNNLYKTIDFLLSDSNLFIYMDTKQGGPRKCINDFIRRKIAFLQDYVSSPATVVHNANPSDQPELYYQFLKHYIKQNETSQQPNFNYLLTIDSVRHLAERIDDQVGNELLNLALSHNNISAAANLAFHSVIMQKWVEDNGYFGNEEFKKYLVKLNCGRVLNNKKANPSQPSRSESAPPSFWRKGEPSRAVIPNHRSATPLLQTPFRQEDTAKPG